MAQLQAKTQAVLDIVIFLFFFCFTYGFHHDYVPQYKQGFYCDDPSIRYKFRGDTISPYVFTGIIFSLSFLVFFVTEFCSRWNGSFNKTLLRDSWHSTLHLYLNFIRGYTFAIAVTICTSATVGEPRPYFLDTCKPDFTKINCSDGYITDYTCTAKMTRRQVGSLHSSFISGHASMSIYMSVYLCFYVYKTISLYPSYLTAWIVQTFLLVLGFFCGVSRIIDKQHHWYNVVFGFLIGIACAIYTALQSLNFKERNEIRPSSPSESSVKCDSKLGDHNTMQTIFANNV